MACRTCKSNCARQKARDLNFRVWLSEDFERSVFVPSNARVEFNGAVGNRVIFEECEGRKFFVEIWKEDKRTRICGGGWRTSSELTVSVRESWSRFVLDGPVPKLQIARVAPPPNQAELAIEAAVFAQDINLKADECVNLYQTLLATNGYMGVPFVHRLTKKNVLDLVMKLPLQGMAGLRLGGIVSTAVYKTVADGHIVFNKDGWEDFLAENYLEVGTVVLITIRNSALNKLNMMSKWI